MKLLLNLEVLVVSDSNFRCVVMYNKYPHEVKGVGNAGNCFLLGQLHPTSFQGVQFMNMTEIIIIIIIIITTTTTTTRCCCKLYYPIVVLRSG